MSFFERLKAEASAEWRAYTEHPFTDGMAAGSLHEAAFRMARQSGRERRGNLDRSGRKRDDGTEPGLVQAFSDGV